MAVYSGPPQVVDGETAFARHINDINNAADTAFTIIESTLNNQESTVSAWAALAQKWAEEDEDVEVEVGAYSAKHHAIKAAASASAASASETNAGISEANAAASEINAGNSETNSAAHELSSSGWAAQASSAAGMAEKWADEDEDVEVETGAYSAKHWATKAAASALSSVKSLTGTGVDNTDPENPVISITPSTIGLGNVDNTADADKPISDDTQDALDLKVGKDSDTGAANIPSGTTAQRPTPTAAMFRFNSDEAKFEGYDGTEWGEIGGGGFVAPESVQTVDFTAEAGKFYPIDCSSGDIVITLPASPSVGDWVIIGDKGSTWGQGTGKCYLSGDPIYSQADGFVMNEENAKYVWQYQDGTRGWQIVDGIGEGSKGGSITTIWSGSAASGTTIDWSGTGYLLSNFDTILVTASCIIAGSEYKVSGIHPSAFMLSTYRVKVGEIVQIDLTSNHWTSWLSNVTETTALVAEDLLGSSFITRRVKGIYGIKYA